jgi:NAD(P)-dependent dehydrogenase (short-subunit alcohol dehydrogenase family)
MPTLPPPFPATPPVDAPPHPKSATPTKMPTVLVVGATGNIGVSAIFAALRSKLNVLAIVRNQASAEKLFDYVGTREGITTVEADITSDQGVKGVVDKVRKGELPAFQHVYAAGKFVLRLNVNGMALSLSLTGRVIV